ncbi:TetR/AcrR family transcriptional regulator [Kitasatospora sp. NPDC059722]|uniref:TetR/AcrR family transcriptional regulator n=1 Tax=Kitasatospora sp. NPDC059722 TaxID=3346925 RepID=UPI00367D84F9
MESVETATGTAEPAPRRGYHHGGLREALIEAGVALARTGGPDAVVLRAASRAAGVSHNAAYRHFADHEDLIAAVGERCMHHLGRLMLERAARATAPDPATRAADRLEAIGRAYVDFALTEPGWFRTAFSGASPGGKRLCATEPEPPTAESTEVAEAADRDVRADPGTDPYLILGAALDDLVEAGAMPAEHRPGAQYAAWSAVHGLSALLVDGPLRTLPPAEVESATHTVLAVVGRGLVTPPPPAG